MLFVDATHKLNSLQMPLYVFLFCDGNGQSEIVTSCLVVSEQKTCHQSNDIYIPDA